MEATFGALLQPPTTIFTVTFSTPPPGAISYAWQGAIGCGTFAPFSKRPLDFRDGDQQAVWTHPDAPAPSLAAQDLDGDGIPDFCPHPLSDQPNFSHPGTVSVRITLANGTKILCTYSGSLTGTGECQAVKE